jgi:hypothetical protein
MINDTESGSENKGEKATMPVPKPIEGKPNLFTFVTISGTCGFGFASGWANGGLKCEHILQHLTFECR